MKIVILDGFTLNPGDLSWAKFHEFGEVVIYDRTPANKILERAEGAEILFTNKTPLTEDVLMSLHSLQFVGVLATGYNVVDIRAAKQRGVIVSNVPNYGTASVVQMTFALLLELCQHVQRHSDTVLGGKWSLSLDWCYWNFPLIELSGKTMGIIGFGNIGEKVANVASAFGMNVIATSKHQPNEVSRKNFHWVELDELLTTSDVVSLHCPLFPETKGIINKESLKLMKSSSFLINTSRGPLIVEEDLAEALNKGVIAGAGIDVLSVEPPSKDNPLLKAKNCIITPHIAWATKEARSRLMEIAINNLQAFINGVPTNVVSN
jgi:glycerate dehydrogenase